MANLRITSVVVVNSTTITAQFNENLNPNIGASNVLIESQLENVPNPEILQTSISQNTLTLTVQPLTPQAAYLITFQSTSAQKFNSINGDATLFQDGITNRQLILGPLESNNVVQQFLQNYLRQNIYDISDSSTVVSSVIEGLSILLSQSLYDIRQVKNENYISFSVTDEMKTRGPGPFDRLVEEAAYDVIRVGKTPTGTINVMNVGYTFPYYPISLLANPVTEIIEAVSNEKNDPIATFNVYDFILTVSNQNVSKLTSVTFYYTNGMLPYVYVIPNLGYQILNSEYDQANGFSYALLNNNQFKLSQTILSDPLFSTQNILNVQVSYEFRNLGRIINPNSVTVTTILNSPREVIPPIINIFNLKNAPITDQYGNAVLTGGVTFTDPNAATANALHPAFTTEIPYSLSALPYTPGQYAIDYPTGTVYVFGADSTNSGTGPEPPLATYYYEYTYKTSIDYTFDSDTNDLVALPNGSLINNLGTINFNYEQVLIPGIDYNADVHIEVLSEYVNNNLLALNVISAQNLPVTNVFRIYNETSGEIYGISRWVNNKIYFTYNNAPNIEQITGERASFTEVLNEQLFVNQQFTNSSDLLVFQCNLSNDDIISGTQDCIASSINSSMSFSNYNIFTVEKWWDGSTIETTLQNINRLTAIGQYQVDYVNGIVYVAVSNNQSINVGTVSYKSSSVVPQNPHIISVDDIYYRISLAVPKGEEFQYNSFSDTTIAPANFEISDEAFLNDTLNAPYEVLSGQVGVFIDDDFIVGVTSPIKFVRGLFEYNDLKNNISPLNFAQSSTSSGTVINVNPIVKQDFANVLFDGTYYYIYLTLDSPYLSPNISFNISVIRNSDQAQLWNNSGTIIPGAPIRLNLPGINSPQSGDSVIINYSISINDISRVIVDYNKGEYYIDYSYLADEIIISYEYGDNVLDFRQSSALNTNDNYYVTYKVGALRDALMKNFGSLINVPELATFDVDLDRERYRDAVKGALDSFIIGPTVTAMESLVESITHIQPQIIESAFQNWSLGSSLLNPQGINTTGEFNLTPAKYGNGVTVDQPGQSITFPVSSNLKLEQGSFQTWILPEWSGIDNDAAITVNVMNNGVLVNSNLVFIGAAEYHPIYDDNGNIVLNKNSNVVGTPNTNKDGVFIYYDFDPSNLYKKWYLKIIDGYADGYGSEGSNNYTVTVKTQGSFYNVKSITFPKPSTLSIQSGTNNIFFRISSSLGIQEGISFIADRDHYLLDFGTDINTNRVSIFKDPSGYMNFRVFDNKHGSCSVSADVSSWIPYQLHHVAASWIINSKNSRDEIHLFIDGFEVPNIIRYGNKVGPYLHEKFRTINPEEIAGVVTKSIVGSVDLQTTAGSPSVFSSLNFSAYGINTGDTLYINESGFNQSGYTILEENGNTLVLDTNMPITLTNGVFSVNTVTLPVLTEISLYPNIAVSTISSIASSNDLVTNQGSNIVSSASANFIALGIQPGYLLRIQNKNFDKHYVILNVSTNSVVLNSHMPETLSNLTYYLYENNPVEIPGVNALRPSYSITQDVNYNDELVITNSVKANDLILITTLGMNHKRVRQKFYQWGNASNVIQTRLSTPINLNSVDIYHILFTAQNINSSNCTVVSNVFTSNTLVTDQPSVSTIGRTLAITISTNKNLVYPCVVNISGTTLSGPVTEAVTFNSLGIENTINQFLTVTGITVNGTCVNPTNNFLTLQIQEAYPITYSEGSTIYPVIRYSYQTRAGTTLSSVGGNVITDVNGFFSSLDVNNYIVIISPSGPAGTYQISAVSDDHLSATITGTVPAFTNGSYQVLNTTTFRNGFQNGYFVLEQASSPGTPYLLNQGSYEFDFYTYLVLSLDPLNVNANVGTDLYGKGLFNGTIDELKITSIMLSDTRVGESVPNNQETITKDFNSIKALTADVNTLALIHFDTFPFSNVAPFYITSGNSGFIQSGISINDNFNQSLYVTNKPLITENDGVLHSTTQGTIEFWVNPLYDTSNDPNYRFYFDATGVEIENTVSLDDGTVQVSGLIGQVISVTLQAGDSNIDYFAGGRVEFSTNGAISESALSSNNNTVTVSQPVLQVITVKIVGDPTQTDYFAKGSISSDKSTIYLGKDLPQTNLSLIIVYKPFSGSSKVINGQVIRLNRRLPNQNMPVVVKYIPSGLQGDRISIFKDPYGYLNFNVKANNIDYVVKAPAFWTKGSWHRVKATYTANSGKGTDTIRLFMDGYERGNFLFGSGIVFGQPYVLGAAFAGQGSGIQANIELSDFFGELYIGTDYEGNGGAYALINNFRISNIARPIFEPYGESIDVNYNSNLEMAFPVTQDLYTTLILDFNTLVTLNQDFVMLANKNSGMFDFTINIFDSFGIVSGSAKVQELLETLINILKPANSRVFLKYIT